MKVPKEAIIVGLDNERLVQEFLSYSSRMLGEVKLNDIIQKVNSSNKMFQFLKEARKLNVQPGSDDFLACIHSSLSFTFAKAETIAIASIILLMKWNKEIVTPKLIPDNIYLNRRFFALLEKCDRYRTHLKSGPNFFEHFFDNLDVSLKRNVINSIQPEIKEEIWFDEIMCNGIRVGIKTEFRVNDNLQHINFTPDDWKIENYVPERGAILHNIDMDENVLAQFPYKLGSKVTIYNTLHPEKPYRRVKIKSGWLERINQVDEMSAQREGFGAYKERIEDILIDDPSADAALCIFRENWTKVHGRIVLARNEWLWAFEFEEPVIKGIAKSSDLTDDAMRALLDVDI